LYDPVLPLPVPASFSLLGFFAFGVDEEVELLSFDVPDEFESFDIEPLFMSWFLSFLVFALRPVFDALSLSLGVVVDGPPED
jgi:hypothetical protein